MLPTSPGTLLALPSACQRSRGAQQRPDDNRQRPHPVARSTAWPEDATNLLAFRADHVEVAPVAGMIAQLVARPTKLERNLRHSTLV